MSLPILPRKSGGAHHQGRPPTLLPSSRVDCTRRRKASVRLPTLLHMRPRDIRQQMQGLKENTARAVSEMMRVRDLQGMLKGSFVKGWRSIW
jgi:hypothetical protein